MTAIIALAAAFLLLVNSAAFIAFWADKRRAQQGAWRISESTLLGLALLGGTPGALVARRLFRHKTRKEPFSTCLLLIAMLQTGALAGWQLGG